MQFFWGSFKSPPNLFLHSLEWYLSLTLENKGASYLILEFHQLLIYSEVGTSEMLI
jgi:hypothetical protein